MGQGLALNMAGPISIHSTLSDPETFLGLSSESKVALCNTGSNPPTHNFFLK